MAPEFVKLEPGASYALVYDDAMSQEAFSRIRAQWLATAPPDTRLMVISGGMRLELREAAPAGQSEDDDNGGTHD